MWRISEGSKELLEMSEGAFPKIQSGRVFYPAAVVAVCCIKHYYDFDYFSLMLLHSTFILNKLTAAHPHL